MNRDTTIIRYNRYMQNPVAISLSPNAEKDDVLLALKTLFKPWIWKKGRAIDEVEQWFWEKFNVGSAYSFNSGRSALWAILNAFSVGSGDDVILQAFTCVAVPEIILAVGAKPVYVDVDTTFNIDPEELIKKISPKTKAVIVQHTFGVPAQIRRIREIARRNRIILIEDCAHALGATVDGKLVGTFGDAAFFSFGRDKIVSSVFGGVAIISNQNSVVSQKLRAISDSLTLPSYFWIFQQLLHPVLFAIILPLYNVFNIGKVLLVIFQRLNLLSFPIYPEEKQGKMPSVFPKKYPNGLAILILNQLRKLDEFNKKRVSISSQYGDIVKEAVYLRYPILVTNQKELLKKAWKERILFGNWYHNVIDPSGSEFSVVGYQKGMCPKAEEYAAQIVNLPTYPRMSTEDVRKVTKIMKSLNH